jgi:hypothetical protein
MLISSRAMDDNADIIAEFVRLQTAVGELDAAALAVEAVEYMTDEMEPEQAEPVAWAAIADAFAAHAADQRTWPESTDNDRLTLAFRDLETTGIVARENFACCRNCGMTEIRDEIAAGQTARGFVFYHAQGAEHGAAGEGVTLYYDALDGSDTAATGTEIVAALTGHGLTPRWSGSGGQGIHVPMVWQRRRSGHDAAFPTNAADGRVVQVTGGEPGSLPDGTYPLWHLASLYLPWLATGATVRLQTAGVSAAVTRRWDRLVAELPDGGHVEVGRFDGVRLIDMIAGKHLPVTDIPVEDGLVEAFTQYLPQVPYDAAGVIDLLRRMPVYGKDFLVCVGRSGGCVQMKWEGNRLWLESPDSAAGTSIGRHVSIDEAERMITILAAEDHVAVGELGDLETARWGG